MATEKKEAAKKQLNIEIISDNICPWCFVGKRNLETALSKLNKKNTNINISWTAYELDPTLPKYGSIDKKSRYASKFGDRMKVMTNRLSNVGLVCTPPINFKWGGKVGGTFNSHRLVMYAEKIGKHNETVEMIMHYYFELNKDIADTQILTEIGNKVGLTKVDEFLKSNQFVDDVNKQLKRSRGELQVTGVPTFIINKKQRFSGGRAADFFLMTFQAMGFHQMTANDFEDENDVKDEKIKLVTKDYVFKNINYCNNKIICLDNDFNDVIFELPSDKDLLEKIKKIVKDGQDQKKDVKITVSMMKKNNKETQTVSDAKIV